MHTNLVTFSLCIIIIIFCVLANIVDSYTRRGYQATRREDGNENVLVESSISFFFFFLVMNLKFSPPRQQQRRGMQQTTHTHTHTRLLVRCGTRVAEEPTPGHSLP